MEVRTGKTLTAFGICNRLVSVRNVLFVTKKKAISSILHDYSLHSHSFNLEVINYESLHKIPKKKWDVIIIDEAHSLGAFPKKNKRCKDLSTLVTLYKLTLIHI